MSGAATVPSRGVHSPYLRCSCRLVSLLITEVEGSQSAEVGSTKGNAPLFSDSLALVPCIQPLLPSHNYISSAVPCFLSLFSTSLRTAGR